MQEELAARVAEEINHSLFRLSIVTTVFLPMTLITGIFGMAGQPGLEDKSAFLWVTLIMIGVGLLTLLVMHWKRLF